QGLVPAPQLLAQGRHDRLAVGPVLFDLVLVDTDDVTPALDPDLLHLQGRGALGVDHAEAAGVAQHLLADFLAAPHPRPQDVRPALLLQVGDRRLAEHAPVSHNADFHEVKAAIQAVHDRDQCGHVAGVARPQLTTDRPAVAVEHGTD